MNNKKLILAAIGSSLCVCASLVEAQSPSINVALDRNASGSTITFATSALGYDAADTSDSGTLWNNVYNEGGVGTNTSLTAIVPANSAVGSYQFLYSIGLQDSAGNPLSVTLSATMNATSVDGHGEYNNVSPAGATGLMAQSARIYSGGDNATWTFAGLTAGAQYNLYLYGVGGSVGNGAAYTLAAPNDAPSGVFSAQTTDGTVTSTGNNVIWDGSGNVTNGPGLDPNHLGNNAYGVSWVELNAVADGSGNLIFTENKAASGVDYISGFQLQPVAVPEPSAFALAGLGLIGLITMNYRRGCMSR
jgi:hypothetical protein